MARTGAQTARILLRGFFTVLPRKAMRSALAFASWTLSPAGRFSLACLFCAATFAYSARALVKVHLRPDAKFVSDPHSWEKILHARRGGIYDRNGRGHPLAETLSLWQLHVDPANIRDGETREKIYRAIAARNAFPNEKLFAALSPGRTHFRSLGFTSDSALVDDIRTNGLFRYRIGITDAIRRVYPLGRGLCHVVGMANSREQPLMGLELSMDKWLRGTNGCMRGTADGRHREIRELRCETIPARDGCDIILSIDQNLQFALDEALDEAMEQQPGPRAAWALALDPNTGEILAMASRPDFDPGAYRGGEAQREFNRCISTLYEPGSVMKAFAAAAAMEEGLVGPDTLLDVSPGLYCGKPLRDHTHGQNRLTVAQMLAWSSNRGASRLGMMLGKARQQAHLKSFGFGRATGLPLRGEGAGQTIGDGSDLNNIRISMGQGMTATAIQLALAYGAIANGGKLMKPILVREILNPDGSTAFRAEPEVVARPISEHTAAQLREMLKAVVSRHGTARRARVDGYTVAGKTGTAQMVEGRHYSQTDFRGSFIGFLPADAPQLVILVTCEATPKPRTDGGVCAAPVFARFAAEAARILQIPPDDIQEP